MRFNKKLSRSCFFMMWLVAPILFSANQPVNDATPLKPNTHFFSFFPSLSELRQGHLVAQLGGYWVSQGEAQNINIRYLFGDHYTVGNSYSQNGLFGLGYYINGLDKDRFKLLYGINAFYLAKTDVSGTILQESEFTNLAYSYKVQHIPIYVGAKALIKNAGQTYNLTLDAGIGPNIMQVYGYNETALNDYTIPANSFAPHTNVVFSAMAGIGLRLNHFFGHVPFECGYRFFYLGQGHLAMNNNQLLNSLTTGNAFGNAILCSITV